MGPFATSMRLGLFLCLKIECVVGIETYMWVVREPTTPPVRFGIEPRLRSRHGMFVFPYYFSSGILIQVLKLTVVLGPLIPEKRSVSVCPVPPICYSEASVA